MSRNRSIDFSYGSCSKYRLAISTAPFLECNRIQKVVSTKGKAMKSRLLGAATIAGALISGEALGHNVRMTPNLSPYLHLTRGEFQLNDSFPVYQKLVRPQLDQRQSRTRFPNAAASSRPLPHLRPAFSPYLHLSRKYFNPLFPVYQSVVRPLVEQRNRPSHLRHVAQPSEQGRKSFFVRPPIRSSGTPDFRALPARHGAPKSQPTKRLAPKVTPKNLQWTESPLLKN